MIAPQHAVSAWIGHCKEVSEKHYLQVTDDMYDMVTRKTIAKSLQTGVVKDSQEQSGEEGDEDAGSSQTLVSSEENVISFDGPGRIRTCDRAIMSRLL